MSWRELTQQESEREHRVVLGHGSGSSTVNRSDDEVKIGGLAGISVEIHRHHVAGYHSILALGEQSLGSFGGLISAALCFGAFYYKVGVVAGEMTLAVNLTYMPIFPFPSLLAATNSSR